MVQERKDKQKRKTKKKEAAKKKKISRPPETQDEQAQEMLLAEMKDKLLRALAENENNRQRFERESAEKSRYAHADFARALLPTLDNVVQLVEMAETLGFEDAEKGRKWLEVLRSVLRELEKTFTQFGIHRVTVAKGDVFDYRLHEAVSEVNEGDTAVGSVFAQLRCGYQLHERLLRPAMVVVRGQAQQEKDEQKK